MTSLYRYHTPIGFDDLLINFDGEVLTDLWFESSLVESGIVETQNFAFLPSIIHNTCHWLDMYFSGCQPNFTPVLRMDGLTPFRKTVIEVISNIPWGQTMTYDEIAKRIGCRSAQAVGGAVGWNPICLIVPCHRVIGANGKLVGYSGGLNNKIALLRLEGHIEFVGKPHHCLNIL